MTTRFVDDIQPGAHIYSAPAYGRPFKPFVVVNHDPSNPLYYADSPGLLDLKASTIDPNTYVVFDGSTDVWASTLMTGVTVEIDVKFGAIGMGNVA